MTTSEWRDSLRDREAAVWASTYAAAYVDLRYRGAYHDLRDTAKAALEIADETVQVLRRMEETWP